MRSQTRLVKRQSVYYFRARFPEEFTPEERRRILSEWFQERVRVRIPKRVAVPREIAQSLKEKNKGIAESLVRIKTVELDALFDKVRRERAEAPRTTITDAEISRIVAKATATRMSADEEGRLLGLTDEDFARHLSQDFGPVPGFDRRPRHSFDHSQRLVKRRCIFLLRPFGIS